MVERFNLIAINRRAPNGGSCRVAAPPPKKQDLKNANSVAMMISKVLHDLPFNCNQPWKFTDD
jgi:hypothetical protein